VKAAGFIAYQPVGSGERKSLIGPDETECFCFEAGRLQDYEGLNCYFSKEIDSIPARPARYDTEVFP
jgi:hypothetical protein